jgi:hypothetical protein
MRNSVARMLPAALALLALLPPTVAHAGSVTQTHLGSAGGYDYWKAQGNDLGSGQSFFIFAECAEGDAVTGGGGLIATAPADEARLTMTSPFHVGPTAGKPREAWAVGAKNEGNTSSPFSAYAICRKAGSDGLVYRSASSPLGSADTTTVTARCPSGSAVLGGGAQVIDTLDGVFINRSRPFDDGDRNSRPEDGWQVRVFNNAGNYTLKAWAICTSKGTSHVHYRSDTREDITGPGTGDAGARCHDDEVAVGGGASMSGPPGRGWISMAYPFASKADIDLIPEDGWDAIFDVESPAGTDLTAWATCKG